MASDHVVINDDTTLFFDRHFSAEAVANFTYNYLNPAVLFLQEPHETQYDEQMYQTEGDDLGYYHDGVKRTLTDEQIEIFRQSELRDLWRQNDQALKAQSPHVDANQDDKDATRHQSPPRNAGWSRKKKKGRAVKSRYEPKPDLRKRTWDVVEKGIDFLDYD